MIKLKQVDYKDLKAKQKEKIRVYLDKINDETRAKHK